MSTPGPTFTEEEARKAIAASLSYAETLRRLGLCPSGGNWRTVKRYATEVWHIPVDHFDPHAAQRRALLGHAARVKRPLVELLVEHSTYSRGSLKARLFAEGLKERRCELCGQGEFWRGAPLALILDHINGTRDDNRLENLRIVCPNCAATFPTHCGRKNLIEVLPRPCARCGERFVPSKRSQRYCSQYCARRRPKLRGPKPEHRRAVRPPYGELLAQVRELGWSGVGRRYGVSDNAIRKWVQAYEVERAEAARDSPSQPA